jgi:hypothetical protein
MTSATSSPTTTPTQTPVEVPHVEPAAWPQRFTDPIHICPQQKRELTSPDVAP